MLAMYRGDQFIDVADTFEELAKKLHWKTRSAYFKSTFSYFRIKKNSKGTLHVYNYGKYNYQDFELMNKGAKPMKEEWKEIKDEDFISYRVSNMGRVCDRSGRVLPSKGNHITLINRQGAHTTRSVAKLVADAFDIKKPSTKAVLGHKDGDIDNNRISNLFWDTDYFNKKSRANTSFNQTCWDCLHSIEDDFGTVMNVSADDPRMRYIWKHTCSNKYRKLSKE